MYANPEKIVEKAYGPWLRAPSRNAMNNNGSRWLQNTRRSDGMRGKQGDSTSTSVAEYGGDQAKERFMEVEGVICEKKGDDEEIRIVSRAVRSPKIGEVVMSTLNQMQRDEINSQVGISTEKVVIDPKRKRLDEDLIGENCGGENGGMENMQIGGNQQNIDSKNLQRASPGVQARRGL